MVTIEDLFGQITAQLQEAGCEDPAFDARCLLEDLAGLPHGRDIRQLDIPLSAEQEQLVRRAADERAAGRPLQYILGEWDFLDMTLRVGEGVLIPRPDTELLCEAAAQHLRRQVGSPERSLPVLDLCAGSGCVGLGVARLVPEVTVTAVELSAEAFPYLEENIRRYPNCSVQAIRADVLLQADRFPGPYRAILSNPPYIPTYELPELMREVQHEPRMALDGGDGLQFYRVIACDWTLKLCSGGFCAVEVGQGQADEVAALWKEAGLQEIEVFRDYGGIDRVVLGYRL